MGFGGAAGLPEVGVDGLAHLDLEGEVGAPGRDEGVDAVAGPELDGVLEAVDLDGERRDAVVAVGEARRARARVEGDEVVRVEESELFPIPEPGNLRASRVVVRDLARLRTIRGLDSFARGRRPRASGPRRASC